MNDSRAYKAKFLMFKQYFPAMCHEAWAAGAFLSALRRPDMQDASFTECCLGLWDDAIDLTWVSYLEPKKDAAFLRCLDGRRVLLNADAFSVVRCEKEGTAELAYWINRADIEPSCFTEGECAKLLPHHDREREAAARAEDPGTSSPRAA